MKRCQFTFEMLLNAYEGRAEKASREAVHAHLASGCESCRQSWEWLQRVLSAAKQMESVPVPEWPVALATAAFRARYVKPARPSWVARLVFDSHSEVVPALVRGEGELARHLVYSAADYDIEVWQEAISGEACYLIGQVLPKYDGAAITLRSVAMTDSAGQTLSIVPEGGEFHLPAVSRGRYEMRLELEDGDIRLSDVIVGA